MMALLSAGVFTVANGFDWMIGKLPEQVPSLSPCARMTPTNALEFGVSDVILIVYSPLFPVDHALTSWPCGLTVPVNVSVTFFDGSTTPPQLTESIPAAVNATAAANRAFMMSFLRPADRF